MAAESRATRTRGVYVISVAAELAGVHPQTLRIYERKGLLDPARTVGGNRRYSEGDIDRLRRIAELTADGLNLAGVKRVLELEEELDERCTTTSSVSGVRRRDAVDEVSRRHRRDLVPLSQSMVVFGPQALDLRARPELTMALDPNKWTHKTQEAFAAALDQAQGEQQPRGDPRPPDVGACSGRTTRLVLPIVQKLGLAPLMLRNRADEAVARLPKAYGGESRLGRELNQVMERADDERKELHDEYLSTEHSAARDGRPSRPHA